MAEDGRPGVRVLVLLQAESLQRHEDRVVGLEVLGVEAVLVPGVLHGAQVLDVLDQTFRLLVVNVLREFAPYRAAVDQTSLSLNSRFLLLLRQFLGESRGLYKAVELET